MSPPSRIALSTRSNRSTAHLMYHAISCSPRLVRIGHRLSNTSADPSRTSALSLVIPSPSTNSRISRPQCLARYCRCVARCTAGANCTNVSAPLAGYSRLKIANAGSTTKAIRKVRFLRYQGRRLYRISCGRMQDAESAPNQLAAAEANSTPPASWHQA
eukprot:3932776-Rhodomonas_salina.2